LSFKSELEEKRREEKRREEKRREEKRREEILQHYSRRKGFGCEVILCSVFPWLNIRQ
jgi:hypothetical protein